MHSYASILLPMEERFPTIAWSRVRNPLTPVERGGSPKGSRNRIRNLGRPGQYPAAVAGLNLPEVREVPKERWLDVFRMACASGKCPGIRPTRPPSDWRRHGHSSIRGFARETSLASNPFVLYRLRPFRTHFRAGTAFAAMTERMKAS